MGSYFRRFNLFNVAALYARFIEGDRQQKSRIQQEPI